MVKCMEASHMKKILVLVLAALMITAAMPVSASQYAPIKLTAERSGAVNLFLSNFTEAWIDGIEDCSDDYMLVDFAHDHLWFNDNDSFEYGDYANGNNCRVSDDRIQEIIDKYFYDSRQVDLSQTRYDYIDGYYYDTQTGGFIPGGFAHAVSMCPIGDGKYYVSFMIFGAGDYWDNSVMDDSLAVIEANFGHPCGYGCAIVYAEDTADRSTYKMVSYNTL